MMLWRNENEIIAEETKSIKGCAQIERPIYITGRSYELNIYLSNILSRSF
jgi:hypothetical protein